MAFRPNTNSKKHTTEKAKFDSFKTMKTIPARIINRKLEPRDFKTLYINLWGKKCSSYLTRKRRAGGIEEGCKGGGEEQSIMISA